MLAADRALQQAATTVQQALSSATRAASAAAAQAAARAAGQAGGGGSSSSGSSASRASRVASDEVAILEDQSAVSQAQSDVAAATLTAPEGGTVARVDYAAGQSASSGSGIVIVGAGPATVTVDVPLSDMSLVKPGLTASVTPSGAAASAAGTVTSVDLVPASSSSSTPAYPARVDVAVPTAAMAPGAGAVVVIAIQTVPDAVRVPASALSGVTAGTGSVTVISGSAGTPTRVSVGAIGGGWAQITKGLTAGQRVLIADPAQPLPSNTTVTGRFGGGGLGGGAGFIRRATGG
jgi:multidrug efflux pump subunit AcrA (membrane-fusion protein)